MVFNRLIRRIIVLVFWLILMSVLGFGIAVSKGPIGFTLNNYFQFLHSALTGSFFFLQPLHPTLVIKRLLTTFELIVVSTCFALVFSFVLTTYTFRRPRIYRWLVGFFTIFRIVPFITLPLLLNQVVGHEVRGAIQQIDNNNLDLASWSRLWQIIVNPNHNNSSLFFSFLGISATTSYFIIPAVFVIFAKVTKQITNYPYVRTLNNDWHSFRIMRRMVLHRLIPVLLNELPAIIASFFMFVCVLEYLFDWRGIGNLLFSYLKDRDRNIIELGFIVFILGSFFFILQGFFTFSRALYDRQSRKELSYEAE